MVDTNTAKQGKDFAAKIWVFGCAKWAHLEGEGTMSQRPLPAFGTTRETSKFSLDLEAGGFAACGMDADAVDMHEKMQNELFVKLRRVGEEMALKAWENDEVLVRVKQDMIKIFIDDNEDVKKMKKGSQPSACDPAAMTDFPMFRKQWLRKCMGKNFFLTGDFPPMLKMKCNAYKAVWRNNQNTGTLQFNPPRVVNAFGSLLNPPGGEMTTTDDGDPVSVSQMTRHVKGGDLVNAQVQLKMWVVNENCGMKLQLVYVKKLADGPGEAKGAGDDIDTDIYGALAAVPAIVMPPCGAPLKRAKTVA